MAAQVPYPDMAVQIALQARPNSSDTPAWTDVSELLIGAEAITRGHPYQVPAGQTSSGRINLRDPQELFNPANTVDSPFGVGATGRAILPYRQIVWQAMHPRGTGNLLNANTWRTPIDPSLESYANGSTPSGWLGWSGAVSPAPTIINTSAFQGTQSLRWNVTNGAGEQSIIIGVQVIPGRFYNWSAYVFQGVANTIAIWVGGKADMATTTATNAWTRINGVFWADQPQMNLVVGTHGATINGTIGVDAIMLEPVTPASPTLSFNGPDGGGSVGQTSFNGWRTQGIGSVGGPYFPSTSAAGHHLRAVGIHPDGVGNPQWQSPEFAVTGNTQYRLAGRILHPALSRNIDVWWYDASHAFISSNFTTFASGSSDWTTMAPTLVTSPANAAFARVGTEAGAVVSTDWFIDHAYLCLAAPSAFTTTGPVIYPVLRQYVERWPRRWESNGFEGFADLQLVDGFAALNAIKPHTEYVEAVLVTNPLYYWRLAESGGATFADSSGNGGPPLRRLDGTNGAASTFSAGSSVSIPGNPGAVGLSISTDNTLPWTNGGPSSSAIAGAGGVGNPPLTIGGGNPANYTMAFWYTHTGPMASLSAPFGIAGMSGGSLAVGNGIFVQVTADNFPADHINVVITWPSGLASIHTATDPWEDGQGHLFIVTVAINGAGSCTVTLFVDGVQQGTTTSAGVMPAGGLSAATRAFVAADLSAAGTPTGVPVANSSTWTDLAVWGRILSGAEITDLANAGKGYNGELPVTRINRRLTRGGYLFGTSNIPSPRLSTGRTTMGPSSAVDLSPMLTELQNITLAEMGTLWIAPDGALVFESRDDRFKRITPNGATFGEDFTNGECTYQPGALYDFDPLYLFASVQITQSNGIIATGGRTADINAAGALYFGRQFQAGPLDMSDANQVQDYADWTFYSHNTPVQRVESVTVDPMANPALWPFVLGVEIGQRVRVRRRPRGLSGGLTYDQQYFVEQVLHGQINLNTAPWTWKTTVSLTPIPSNGQPWILDDVNLSVLGSTTRLGF